MRRFLCGSGVSSSGMAQEVFGSPFNRCPVLVRWVKYLVDLQRPSLELFGVPAYFQVSRPHGFWISSSARPLSAISASTPNTLRAAVRVSRDLSRSLSFIVYFSSAIVWNAPSRQKGPAGGRRSANRVDRRQEGGPDKGWPLLPHQPGLQGLELFAGQVALVEEAGEAFELAHDTPAVGAGVLSQGTVHPFYVGYAAEAHSHA